MKWKLEKVDDVFFVVSTDGDRLGVELGSALQPYPVYWNPHNGVVQCHCCGTIYDPRNSKPNHDDCCGQWPKHASNCNYATGN